MNMKSYIFVRNSKGKLQGCELVLNKGLFSAGLILQLYYNSLKSASELIELGKIYYLGIYPASDYSGTLDKLKDLFLSEIKMNVNFLVQDTIAYHRNLGSSLEVLSDKDYDDALKSSRTLYLFEDGSWYVYLNGASDKRISIKKLIESCTYYKEIATNVLRIKSSWDYVLNRVDWLKYLHDLDRSGYQLATKIDLKQVLLEDAITISPSQIPFQKFKSKENFSDYYVAVDKSMSAHCVSMGWIRENINQIVNAEFDGSCLYFVMNKRGECHEFIKSNNNSFNVSMME